MSQLNWKRPRPAWRATAGPFAAANLYKFASLICLGMSFLVSQARAANALTFFKNYFVAGDYVTGGVGLRGQGVVNSGVATMVGGTNQLYATGTIHMGDVPQNADLL